MWFAAGILTYLILAALVLLFLIAASRIEDRVSRLKDRPGIPLLRSRSSQAKAYYAGALRKTGTGR